MMAIVLPPLPDENEDPWFEDRQAFDLAVKNALEGDLSDAPLNALTALNLANLALTTSNGSVSAIMIEYAVSTDEMSAPTVGWSVVTPEREPGEFIWMRTTFVYPDSSVDVSSPVLITGNRGVPGIQGPPGDDGPQGEPGQAGRGVTSTEIHYQKSENGVDAPIGDWTTGIPTTLPGEYLWTRTTINYTSGSPSVSYSVGRMGTNGNNGVAGPPGTDGQTSYLHIAYANSADGTVDFSVTNASGKSYMGTYTDFTLADSDNPNSYSWSLIKGSTGVGISSTVVEYAVSNIGDEPPGTGWGIAIPTVNPGQYFWTRTTINFSDSTSQISYSTARQGDNGLQGIQGDKGDQGIQGPPGDDGLSSYTHIAYADSDTGTGFSQTPSGKEYIGLYVDNLPTDSTDPDDYAWSLIKGDTGDQGIPGAPGEDGLTPYFHTAWADSSTGDLNFNTTTPGSRTYLGTYTDYTEADSLNPSVYAWVKIQGLKGDKGDEGADGVSVTGATVTYQKHTNGNDHPEGAWSSNIPTVNPGEYLWTRTITTYSDTTSTTAYSVGMFGPQGDIGDQGPPGTNGLPSYFHVAYANNSTGTSNFSTTDPSGRSYMGVYTDNSAMDSEDPEDYSWSLIKGETGNGIDTVDIHYQVDTQGTTIPSGAWVSTYPVVPEGQFLWTRTTTTFTDSAIQRTYSAIKQGETGPQGVSVTSVTPYYYLTSGSAPAKPGVLTPPSPWDDYEPSYTPGSSEKLYITQRSLLSNGTFVYSNVVLSSSYEAAKSAYNAALAAQQEADDAGEAAQEAQDKADAAHLLAGTAESNAQSAIASASNRNATYHSTAIPTGVGTRTGDIWYQWTSMAVGGKLIAQWVWNSSSWQKRELDETFLPQVNIGDGTYGQLSGGRLQAQSVGADVIDAEAIFANEGFLEHLTSGVIYADTLYSLGQNLNLEANGAITLLVSSTGTIEGRLNGHRGELDELDTRVTTAQTKANAVETANAATNSVAQAAASAAAAAQAKVNGLALVVDITGADMRLGRPEHNTALHLSNNLAQFKVAGVTRSIWEPERMTVPILKATQVIVGQTVITDNVAAGRTTWGRI